MKFDACILGGELRPLDVVGEVGFKERQRWVARAVARLGRPGRFRIPLHGGSQILEQRHTITVVRPPPRPGEDAGQPGWLGQWPRQSD